MSDGCGAAGINQHKVHYCFGPMITYDSRLKCKGERFGAAKADISLGDGDACMYMHMCLCIHGNGTLRSLNLMELLDRVASE